MRSDKTQPTPRTSRPIPWQHWLVLGVVLLALIAAFMAIAVSVPPDGPMRWGATVLAWAHRLASPALTGIMVVVTSAGGFMAVPVLAVVAAGLFWYHRRRDKAVALGAVVAATAVMVPVLKRIFERARPDLWPDPVTTSTYAFPSGHAMLSSALAFMLIMLLWDTRWRWPVLAVGTVYVLAVGFSRVYLGVHYPSDVIAAWCISGVLALLASAGLKAWLWLAPHNQSNSR